MFGKCLHPVVRGLFAREIDTEFSVDLLLSNQRIGNSYIILTSDVTEVSLRNESFFHIFIERCLQLAITSDFCRKFFSALLTLGNIDFLIWHLLNFR